MGTKGVEVVRSTGTGVGDDATTNGEGVVTPWRSRSGSRAEGFSIDGGVTMSRSTCKCWEREGAVDVDGDGERKGVSTWYVI